MYCKWKAERLNGYRMVLSVSVIYLCNCVAGWERGLFAAAQHHEHIRPHIDSPGKDQNSDFKVWFLQNTSAFALPWSKKIITQSIVNQVPSLVTSWISKDDIPCFLFKKNVFLSTKKNWAIKEWKTHRNSKYILLSESNLISNSMIFLEMQTFGSIKGINDL